MTEILLLFKNKIFLYIASFILAIGLFTAYSVKIYDMGIEHEKVVVQKQIQKQKKEFDIQRNALNSRIQDLAKNLVQETKQLDKKQETIRERVYVYTKEHNDPVPCLDDEWLRIYNDSLPD